MVPAWLSWVLLILAYLTFGQFLHGTGADEEPAVWVLVAGLAIIYAAILTIFWVPTRRVLLLGFKSDAGYFIMVLGLASLAVIAVVQLRFFSYIMMLAAASLLARVDTVLADFNKQFAFFVLAFLPLLGLTLSWLPLLLHSSPGEHTALLGL